MNWVPRRAVPADAGELVRLRALMFEAMGEEPLNGAWRRPCVEHFRRELATDRLVCVVVDAPDGQGLACCALAEVTTRAPRPTNPTGVSAHVSNVSTDPRWGRSGFARVTMRHLLAELDRRGVPTAALHATADALPLYESLGFRPSGAGVELRRSSVRAPVAFPSGHGPVDPVPPSRG
ncbi:MAG: GNAT family N-acetyltransferase [Kutzneria sp.]|nr:GNAT family N-acetyltransferase [Kutzneria sp.]MBV9847139.1 GNAT family N-acetyltransferase [Kutzneria sp.]